MFLSLVVLFVCLLVYFFWKRTHCCKISFLHITSKISLAMINVLVEFWGNGEHSERQVGRHYSPVDGWEDGWVDSRRGSSLVGVLQFVCNLLPFSWGALILIGSSLSWNCLQRHKYAEFSQGSLKAFPTTNSCFILNKTPSRVLNLRYPALQFSQFKLKALHNRVKEQWSTERGTMKSQVPSSQWRF